MLTETSSSAVPVAPSRGTLRPLSLNQVRIQGGFWSEKQELNATAIIDHCESWMEKVGWIGNFDAAVEGRLPADRTGREFSDSDVYKLLEAMAWEIGRTGDERLDARFRALVARIEPVQEPDGYLNTKFGRPGQAPRYSDLQWGHELYSYGHLLQAAVARGRSAGPDDALVRLARRAADHVCDTFGEGGIESVCGHPEVEMALVEFGRFTGETRYLDQARLFINRRGSGVLGDIELGRSYYQDDIPVRDAEVLRGHAVRAVYLAAGAVDLGIEDEETELVDAVVRQLDRTVARRTYLTGGMGAHHEGESFGMDFELPSDRAYSETCAGVGSVMLNYRLLLATGEERYADLIERTLFNVVATSPAADGRAFYYTNTLHQREPGSTPPEDEPSPRASSSLRAPWFEVSCCPTNVARTLATLGSYFATSAAESLHVHQYATGEISADIDGGTVAVRVETEYPNDGVIRVTVTESVDTEWELSLRVPGWATSGATLRDLDETRDVAPGSATIRRRFAVGDEIVLTLPVAARWTTPDPRIDALRGQRAVERGPVVLCVESTDVPFTDDVDELRVTGELSDVDGVVTVDARKMTPPEQSWPYGVNDGLVADETHSIRLIPYNSWANRGPSTMRIWLPLEEDIVRA
ncbi:glycoside hydrolase family 127 protein [Mycetocola zhadangensis]|uniref:glycoside hydrolase family 127 protein n=1 Tax=Mycetocola zhadangensis TaxID=1164595 RepID=UPI003A4DD09B